MERRGVKRKLQTDKRAQRLERKMKKIKAFLELVKDKGLDEPAVGNTQNHHPTESSVKPKRKRYEPLTDEELQKLRAEIKARQKSAMQRPKVYACLDHVVLSCDVCPADEPVSDQKSSVDEILMSYQEDQPLFPVDLQHLILYALEGNVTSYKPRWCKLLRQGKVSQLVVIEIPGVSKEMFLSSQHCLTSMKQMKFNVCVQMISPHQYGSTFLFEIVEVTFGYRHQNPEEDRKNDWDEACRLSLLLSPEQMILEAYPLPVNIDDTDGYVFTKDVYSKVSNESPMFAVDCEMCLTDIKKLELTWIAVINEKLEIVYETLVKPHNKIINYLTKYSGITEQKLKPVNVRLEDVQQMIRQILPSDAILCGQSLRGDLVAMKMFHPYVIDTSVIYNLSGLPFKKPSLKYLSQRFLNKTIQPVERRGHSPVEDAITTMELVQLKLRKGLKFGDVTSGWTSSAPDNLPNTKSALSASGESELVSTKCEDQSGVLSRAVVNSREVKSEQLNRQALIDKQKIFFRKANMSKQKNIFTVADQINKKVTIIADADTIDGFQQRYSSKNSNLIAVDKNKRCCKATKQALQDDSFMVWAQFMDETNSDEEGSQLEEKMRKIDRWLKKIAKKCKPNALLIVLFAGNDISSSNSNAVCLLKVIC